MNRRFLGASLVVAAFTGSLIAADGFKSGPQPGDNFPGAFHPTNVCNVDRPANNGKKNCFV
jgi:hypothetical protein